MGKGGGDVVEGLADISACLCQVMGILNDGIATAALVMSDLCQNKGH